MNNLPSACQKCKRWQEFGEQGYRFGARVFGPGGGHHVPQDEVPILIVVPSPEREDVGTASTFCNSRHGQMLLQFCSRLQVPFGIVGAALCAGSKYPGKRERDCCQDFLNTIIADLSPRVLVLLGEEARDAVLEASVSIAKARRHVFQLEPDDIPILLAPNPIGQFEGKGVDLREVIGETLMIAQEIALGTWKNPHDAAHATTTIMSGPLNASPSQVIWNTNSRVEEWRDPSYGPHTIVSLDFEWHQPDDDDLTVWSEGTPLVSIQFGAWNHVKRRYEQYVIPLVGWSRDDLVKLGKELTLLRGYTLVGSWIKIDFQKFWIETCEDNDGVLENGIALERQAYRWQDVHIGAWQEDQSKRGTGLKQQVFDRYQVGDWGLDLDVLMSRLERKLKRKVGMLDLYQHYPDQTMRYAGLDVYWTVRLWIEHISQLESVPAPGQELALNCMPYEGIKAHTAVALEIERNGIYLDVDYFHDLHHTYQNQIQLMQNWLDQHPYTTQAGLTELNTKSPNQLTQICRHWKWSVPTTETGLAEINKSTSKMLVGKGETPEQQFFQVVFQQRGLRDTISKFILPWLNYQRGGIAHTTYSLTKLDSGERMGDQDFGVVTGRAASQKPNVMATSKDSEFQNGIVAPEGCVLVRIDYSTIEPLLTAFLSRCEPLMQVFRSRIKNPDSMLGDVYWANVAQRLGMSLEQIEPTLSKAIADDGPYKKERKNSKIVWLAATYGQHPQTAADNLGVSLEQATSWLHNFYHLYPEVLAAEAEIRKQVFEGKLITTVTGRKRTFPLKKQYPYRHELHRGLIFYQLVDHLGISPLDSEVLRQAVNNAIQGPAGNLGWDAAYRVWKSIENTPEMKSRCWIMEQVHDQLGFYIVEDHMCKSNIMRISDIMSKPSNLMSDFMLERFGFKHGEALLTHDIAIGYRGGEMTRLANWDFE